MGKGRIVEVYYHRKLLKRKNPLGGKTKMSVVGGCVLAIATKGKVKYVGAGTVATVSKNTVRVKLDPDPISGRPRWIYADAKGNSKLDRTDIIGKI